MVSTRAEHHSGNYNRDGTRGITGVPDSGGPPAIHDNKLAKFYPVARSEVFWTVAAAAAAAAAAAEAAAAAVAAEAPSHRESRRKKTAATQLATPRINGQPSF